ncbi:hypothetical protein Dimus_019559 [Dionaea muscipula]
MMRANAAAAGYEYLLVSCSLFLIISWFCTIEGAAQGRAPHGLVYEHPVAFTPSAYEFFHPDLDADHHRHQAAVCGDGCSSSSPSYDPLAAHVRASEARQPGNITSHGLIGAGSILAGIMVGVILAVILAMAVYYVTITRRENQNRHRAAIKLDLHHHHPNIKPAAADHV